MLEDSMSRSCVRGATIASVMEEVLRRMRRTIRTIREIIPTEATMIVWNVWLAAGADRVRKAVSADAALAAGRSENPILFRTEDGAEGGFGVMIGEVTAVTLIDEGPENLPLRK